MTKFLTKLFIVACMAVMAITVMIAGIAIASMHNEESTMAEAIVIE